MSGVEHDPGPQAETSRFRERAQAGSRSTLSTQAIRLGCKAGSVVLLARLVTPAEHGLYAMAASVTLFLLLFRDLCLGPAAVQAATLDETQQSTLLRIHLLLGCILTLLTVALAPVARWFYHAPEVLPLLLTMAPSFLLIGAGGFARAQLARELRFVDLNFVETAAAVAGTLSLIAAALGGAGAYAFATFLLVSEAVTTGLAWRALGWRPRGPVQFSSIRSLLRTGLNLTAYHTITYAQQQLDTYAIGAAFGPRPLGLYSRSTQILALPNQHLAAPLTQVALATLSRLGPHSPQFRAEARQMAAMIAHFTLPVASLCIALPAEVVALVLGQQWPEAAPMLRWLAVSAAITACTALAYGVNVAAGQAPRLMHVSLATLPVTLIAIGFGLGHGPVAVATALAVANFVLAAPRLAWMLHGSPVRMWDYLGALMGALQTAAAFGAGAIVSARLASNAPSLVRLLVGLVGGAVAATALAFASRRIRAEWSYLWDHLPTLRRK